VAPERRDLRSYINPASVLGTVALLLGLGLPAAGLMSPWLGLLMVIAAVPLVGFALLLVLRGSEGAKPELAAPSSQDARRVALEELVATSDEGRALYVPFFQTPDYGPFEYWRERTAAFLETVFGPAERLRFLEFDDPPPSSREGELKHHLLRLADLRGRPDEWDLRVGVEGIRTAAQQRRFRTPGEQIVEANVKRTDSLKRLLAVKDKLGAAMERGRALVGTYDPDEVAIWAHDTAALIEAAFGAGEASQFRSSFGYTFADAGGSNPRLREYVEGRLRRLGELIARADSLSMNPDFDPVRWRSPLASRPGHDPIRTGWLLLYRVHLMPEDEARAAVMAWLAEAGTPRSHTPGSGPEHLSAVLRARLAELEAAGPS
jgi:hypothetical protein